MALVRAWWNGQPEGQRAERVEIVRANGRWWVRHLGPRDRLEYVGCAGPAQADVEATRFLSRGARWRPAP